MTDLSVKSFGAIGDGRADDTAAIQAALDAIPVSGGQLFFPPGIYLFSTLIVPPGMVGLHLQGSSRRATTLRSSNLTTNAVQITRAQLLTVDGFECDTTGQKTGGAFFDLNGVSQSKFSDLRVVSPYVGFNVHGDSGSLWFRHISMTSSNNSWEWEAGMKFQSVAGIYITDCQIITGLSRTTGAAIDIDSGVDTIQLLDTAVGQSAGVGSVVGVRLRHSLAPRSFAPRWVRMTNVHAEGGAQSGFVCEAGQNVELHGCYAASSLHGVHVTGGTNYRIVGGLFGANARHGLFFEGGTGITVIGAMVSGNSASATNTYDGIHVEAKDVTVTYSTVNNSVFEASQHRYAIHVGARSIGFIDGGNRLADAATASVHNAMLEQS